ncbi:deoxyhypusine synthase-like isoform X1 [Thunnus maccoyii]|uniref:deoxyhypusine synthase-like isoform X1 n=1 Tax=Thunnus maccoyii TaxID=8240 RepID=UPI001C4D292C|nr:deoxyhypusine synthase-like isoform X1 [Thunnus maccoyii]
MPAICLVFSLTASFTSAITLELSLTIVSRGSDLLFMSREKDENWERMNNIPVFSPALTDGALGDMFYLFSIENPGLILDIIEDISKLNNLVVAANSTGMITLGGGVAKHHICNANSWRDGANYAVYVNTAQEFDGCDSGARPDEAVSWGKITADAKPVKVFGDATIIFPLLVAETFAVHAKMTAGKKKE